MSMLQEAWEEARKGHEAVTQLTKSLDVNLNNIAVSLATIEELLRVLVRERHPGVSAPQATFICEGCAGRRLLSELDEEAIVMGIEMCQSCRAEGEVYEKIVAEREAASVGAEDYTPTPADVPTKLQEGGVNHIQLRDWCIELIGAINLIAYSWESGNLAEAVNIARELAEGISDKLEEKT